MAVEGKDFKFENEGFSCNEFKGIMPYEKFIAISKFKERYTIKLQKENGKTKTVTLDISKGSHQMVDDYLKSKIPNMIVTEKKCGYFECVLPYLFIPALYIGLLLLCLWFKNSDMDSVRIPIIIYPLFEFMLSASNSTNFLIVAGLSALTCVLGVFSYKKDNIAYKYTIKRQEK